MTEKNKITRSIKIYPIFYGLTADLIFWVAINTLFLTTVKHMSASQINSMSAIATGVSIVFQIFIIKIVRKIGNINAVRLGTIMLFLSITIDTFATTYWGLLIAELLYSIGFVFKNMDNVIVIKDLKHLGKSEEFIKVQTKGSAIYAGVTLAISLISGFLFNVTPYLPMGICMTICFINIFLTYFIYEVPNTENKEIKPKQKISINKTANLIILSFGLIFSMIGVAQTNGKLFIQENMQGFLPLDKVAIGMSICIFISRISRLLSNLIFMKVYNKLKNKIIFLLEISLILVFVLLLLGNFIGKNMAGICVMAIGFFIILLIRDPFNNYMKKIVFENTEPEVHDKVISYFAISRKLMALTYSLIISAMLTRFSYVYVMSLLLILSISYMVLVAKVYKLINKERT